MERAITLVHNNKEWRAKVVYGDTDSLFVLVPGRSRSEAFRIGAEIATAVTQDNPSPVKLKLEKVYQPCILQVSALSMLLYLSSFYTLNIILFTDVLFDSDQETVCWIHV